MTSTSRGRLRAATARTEVGAPSRMACRSLTGSGSMVSTQRLRSTSSGFAVSWAVGRKGRSVPPSPLRAQQALARIVGANEASPAMSEKVRRTPETKGDELTM